MGNNPAIKYIKGAASHKQSKLAPSKEIVGNDVSRVLEHVSSPFRWELLEFPLVQPISTDIDDDIANISRLRR